MWGGFDFMGQSKSKVEKWREKMKQYRASVPLDQYFADLKKAGFTVKDSIKKKNH
jgi:hypothetical protein